MAKSTKLTPDLSEQVQCDDSPSQLILVLGHKDGWVRHHARECLVIIGRPAVPELIEALGNKNEDVRWEAAKALGQIKDPRAAPALVTALNDKNSGVRWLAAEGLIIMRSAAIPPLLQELIHHPDEIWLRDGAHHILHDLSKKRAFNRQLTPVLAALEGLEPALVVSGAAKNFLDTIAMKKPRVRRRLENLIPG